MQALHHLAMVISPIKSHELREVAVFAVAEMKKNAAHFDEADLALRESLFNYSLGHGMVYCIFIE